MTAPSGPAIADVLEHTRVVEFATSTRRGGLSTRPLTSTRLADGRILVTTPIAYAQKAEDVRRDGRVAILYSDPTGRGLADPPSVLVRGTATAPDVVAPPQDLADYWRCLIDRNPGIAESARDPDHRRALEWYYWRIPIYVRPDEVHVLAPTPHGGAETPPAPADQPMHAQIRDAVARYPTAVVTSFDADGRPWTARARVTDVAAGGTVTLRPTQTDRGVAGPANLLWHRFGGPSGAMSVLVVHGTGRRDGDDWIVTPDRVAPTLDAMSFEEWTADARARSVRYLERHGHPTPTVDWDVLAGAT